jgi:hypothetical protein
MAAQTTIGVAMAMRVPGRVTLWLSADGWPAVRL